MLFIEGVLRAAWDCLLVSSWGQSKLSEALEERITAELAQMLSDLRSNSRFSALLTEHFQSVVVAEELFNFDFTQHKKSPDLNFRFLQLLPGINDRYNAVFIEAKPVDNKHTLTGDYCDSGIFRFIDGSYAWAMQEAIMLGYARPGYTIESKLRQALRKRQEKIGWTGTLMNSITPLAEIPSGSIFKTHHNRAFSYPDSGKRAPRITLRHLWLNRP